MCQTKHEAKNTKYKEISLIFTLIQMIKDKKDV